MFGFLLALFVCFVVAGCLLAIIVAMGYSLTPDLGKLAEARAISAPMPERVRHCNEQAWSQRVAAVAMDARNCARFAVEAHERMVRR